ncbi:MAG: sensor histidine kinase [Clostridiales bacterium]|nr:sensor histidine kinase [Clostridiales bacterium]
MIRHLRWKVVATNMLLISLVLLAVFAAVVLISRANYRESVQQQLYQALESGDYGSRQPGAEGIPCFVAEVYASGMARVAGNSYYDLSDQSQLAAIVTEALAQEEDTGLLADFHLRYLRKTGYTSTLIAFTDTTLESTTMRSMAAVCSLAGSAALLVLFLCSYLLSGVVTRPVGAAWAQQEQFLSDASHELKTPLTVILSSAELLNQSALPEQAVYIDNIREESRRMKLLVEDMLTLSRAQRSAGSLPEQTADLSEAAMTAALRFEPVAFEAGKRLEYDIAPELPVRGDGGKLGQALAALLDNAVKYSAGGTDIRLTAEKQGRFAVVTVADSGPDIPADKLPHIFDRFYRADEARTDGDSFGLGLPIAKAIIDAHRGTLRCESGGGVTRFIITLPLAAGKQERGTDHA